MKTILMEGFLVPVKNRTDNNGMSRAVFWLGLAVEYIYIRPDWPFT